WEVLGRRLQLADQRGCVPPPKPPQRKLQRWRLAGLWFRGNFAFGWFTDLPDFQPRARPRPSPQLRVLPVRKPPSSRPWQLLALPPWPLRARPCGRLHAPPSPPPRVGRVRQPRSSLSQQLRALSASPPRARLFAQRRAPPSRQLYASLARWLRA